MKRQKKIGYFTKLDPELREMMRRFKADTGIPEAQQIDRALRQWLGRRPRVSKPRSRKQGLPQQLKEKGVTGVRRTARWKE